MPFARSADTWTPIKSTKAASASGRFREWNITPNFGALPKDQKPVNAYYDVRCTSTTSRTTQSYTSGGVTTSTYNDYELTPKVMREDVMIPRFADLGYQAMMNRANNDAILKALVKVADAKVNVAVAYAEAGKTSDLILDTARRIDRAYRAFRKGNLKGVAENLNITPKRLHKSWLEYKYGWMPLLMDVKGAAEFFAQQHVVRPPRFSVVARESCSLTDKQVTQAENQYGSTTAKWVKTLVSKGDTTTTVKLWCEISFPQLAELQQVGLTNPLLVAWELVPYSFVFDWFISVGDWLTGMTALNGVTVRRKMISNETTRSCRITYPATVNVSSNGLITYRMSARDWSHSERWYQRDVPDISIFSLSPPTIKSFGFQKLVTSLALIQGSHRGNARL